MRTAGFRGGASWEDGTLVLTLVWGAEWWDDKLHARGSSKTWDSLPPNKREEAPLRFRYHFPYSGLNWAGGQGWRHMGDRGRPDSLKVIWPPVAVSRQISC